ncbi:sulfite oxidase [Kordiimonas laminariae]|uniref:sulfite oxidase n=1 Tax=Kordiimonas laminariae TaxID=2917717 RepID=UPI001FF27C51|nr:sulfite oxidase [Kordiimonas laminariae]MCK0070685.1 sulfite oxidase [Kordiimonas laminariae]
MADKKAAMNISRRKLLLGGVGSAAFMLGTDIPFLKNMPKGLLPVAYANDDVGLDDEALIVQKEGLTLLNARPINMETPAHLLDDAITPASRLFVRNNGIVPDYEEHPADSWTITIDGEVETPLTLSIADLKRNFEVVTKQLWIECGGNGRKFYEPGASGNQWSLGAIGCPQWTGVRLRDVLKKAGVKDTAVYTAHHSVDMHLSGDPEKAPISRGVPIAKALEEDSIIAFEMNGEPLPVLNGFPMRLVVPGWPGSCSQKWLKRIQIRDQIHDGPKMTGTAYRMPAYPVSPGTEVPKEDMVIIHEMPVKSLVTYPVTGSRVKLGEEIEIRGHAWSGQGDVSEMEVSIDFGATWQKAKLDKPVNKFAWQHWKAMLTFPKAGYYEVWARATDHTGTSQPSVVPGWNPKGYLNNMQHRVAVFAV